ncbi:MAG: ribosome small subunit-dependent GTPase A [Casimicrobiaceae bacterium]
MTELALVVASYRRHFDVALDNGERLSCVLKGRSAQIACGDQVEIARVAGGGSIESVVPRSSSLYRSDTHHGKLIAANVTQIVGIVAPDLSLNEELINRWMIAAEAEGCRFVLAANKADLPSFAMLRARLAPYAALGYPVVELAALRDVAPMVPWLAQRHSVLVGQSGMGKSTLVNTLCPHAQVRTQDVSAALATGRHTTTSTALYQVPSLGAETWVVDSPGIKAFGLAHLDPARIAESFVEIRPLLGRCRFRDCRHGSEPGCVVQAAVAAGAVAPFRVALLHSLIAEASYARKAAR